MKLEDVFFFYFVIAFFFFFNFPIVIMIEQFKWGHLCKMKSFLVFRFNYADQCFPKEENEKAY